MDAEEQLALLEACAGLREERRTISSERVRRSLAAVELRILQVLPPVTRKRISAQLLAVSVQALDRWIRNGDLAARQVSERVSHHGIPTDYLVDIATLRRGGSHMDLGPSIAQVNAERRLSRDLVDAHHLTIAVNALAAGRSARRDVPATCSTSNTSTGVPTTSN